MKQGFEHIKLTPSERVILDYMATRRNGVSARMIAQVIDKGLESVHCHLSRLKYKGLAISKNVNPLAIVKTGNIWHLTPTARILIAKARKGQVGI